MYRDNYTCPPVPLPLLVPVLLTALLLALGGPLLILSPALLLVTALVLVPLLLASLPSKKLPRRYGFLLRLAGLLRQVTGRLGVHLLQAARLRVTVAADAFGSAFRRPASG